MTFLIFVGILGGSYIHCFKDDLTKETKDGIITVYAVVFAFAAVISLIM